jgi:small subunit ribosomal protein S8
MLTRIRNSHLAGKRRLKVPFSKFDYEIAEALVKKGYLESAEKKGRSIKKIIDISLKYEEDKPKLSGIKLISLPSRRVYGSYRNLRSSKQGYGDYFMTTPQGIMTGREAKKAKVGGEILFEIW